MARLAFSSAAFRAMNSLSLQPSQAADPGLATVLDREQVFLRLPFLLRPILAELKQEVLAVLEQFQSQREGVIAQIFQMRQRVQAIGPSGVPGDENKVSAFLRPTCST